MAEPSWPGRHDARPETHKTERDYPMKNLITRFQNDESGATAIEYGLIAGLVSVVIIAAIALVGTELQDIFGTISTALINADAEAVTGSTIP